MCVCVCCSPRGRSSLLERKKKSDSTIVLVKKVDETAPYLDDDVAQIILHIALSGAAKMPGAEVAAPGLKPMYVAEERFDEPTAGGHRRLQRSAGEQNVKLCVAYSCDDGSCGSSGVLFGIRVAEVFVEVANMQ